MRISTIAFANLSRRKGKALFLVAGIGIGIGTVVALLTLSGSIQDEIGSQLDRFGANIVVVPRSNSLSLDYGGISVSGVSFDVQQLTDADAGRIYEIPYRRRLSVVAPKLLSAVDVEGRQALLAGVKFEDELRLKKWWRITGRAPEADDEVLLGYEVARGLAVIEKVSTHAAATHAGHGAHHQMADRDEDFRITRDRIRVAGRDHGVAGVLGRTSGPEDGMVFGSLAHVQELAGKPGQLSLIEISALCKDCPVEDIVAQVASVVPHGRASAIQQSVRARTETVDRLTRFSVVVSAVVLAIGALMIFTTMMGSVMERTKEIGVLRAIGFRRAHIVQQLLIEVTVISLTGGALGWAAGLLASRLALPYFTETGVQVEIRAPLALVALGCALLIGVAGSIYPALRAARLDPSEAVRYV